MTTREKEEEEARGSRLAADPGGGTEAASRTPLSDFAITSVKADFSSPALQQPLRKSPGKKSSGKGEEWTDVDVYEVGEDGEILFNDAPVALPALTPLEKSSYFGSRARFEFLDIFRQLSRQRYNFKDNKFMTFDDDAEGVVKKSKKDKGFSKPKMKRHGTARFLAVGVLFVMLQLPCFPSQVLKLTLHSVYQIIWTWPLPLPLRQISTQTRNLLEPFHDHQ